MSHFEWVHCNKCTAMGHCGGVFWFTSCGHVVCSNCMNQKGGPSPGRKVPCLICLNVATIMEISRSMRPDLLALFRPPKDLLTEFTKRLKTTMDFQMRQRQSLMKKLNEKCEKAYRYAKAAQAELLQRIEREKALLAERNQLRVELEKAREHTERMQKFILAQRDQKLHRIQKKTPCRRHIPCSKKKHSGTGGFSSLTDQTPISPLSFLGCATSAPNTEMAFLAQQQNGMHNDGGNTYSSITGMFEFRTGDGAALDDSSLVGTPDDQTTPFLLGMRDEGEGCTLRYF